MRRKDREITDLQRIRALLLREKILRVGFYDAGDIYILPLNYGVYEANGRCTLYVHGAKAGRKYALAKASPKVGFEIEGEYRLIEGETACEHSAAYESIVGTGRMRIVTDAEEKRRGLQCIMRQATGRSDWTFERAMIDAAAVFAVEVETLTCKAH